MFDRLAKKKRDRDGSAATNPEVETTVAERSVMLRQKLDRDHSATAEPPHESTDAIPEFGLPPEIFLEVCRFFTPDEPVRVISRAFHQFFHDNQLWLARLKKHFPEYVQALTEEPAMDYRAHYRAAHHQHYSGMKEDMIKSLYFAREGNVEKLFESDTLEYTRSVYDVARLRDNKYTIFQILIARGYQAILDKIYAQSKTEARPGWTSVLDNTVFTKIHWAIACRQPLAEIQNTLQQCAMQVNLRNHDGSTPLGLAMELDDMKAFEAVLASPFLVPHNSVSKKQNALTLAARMGKTEMVTRILALHVNPNTPSENDATPLSMAAFHGRTTVVNLLLTAPMLIPINVNQVTPDISKQEYYTPLHLAAMQGHLAVIKLLLQHGAHLNTQVLHLLDSNLHPIGTTALHLALSNRHWSVAAELINTEGVEVNIINLHGLSPLHLAMAAGQQKLVIALLERGAELLLNDQNINIVMCFASIFGFIDIAERCVEFDETIKTKRLAIPERMTLPIKTIIKKEASHTPWADILLQPHEIADLMGHDALADLLQPTAPRMINYY